MQQDNSANNKRIAKNTLYLYVRMFLIMIVSLYTSRVVLATLGVIDFGIFNVVGGIVAMMGVFNGAMTSSVQRYLSYEIGAGDKRRLQNVFSVSVLIFFSFAILLIFLAETIGLWFLNTQLVIPSERMSAANWVYQVTLFSVVIKLMTNPYMASIIANERMNIFAYISVAEVFLNLLIVYLLVLISYDKLIMYGILLCFISLIVFSFYCYYCVTTFDECKYQFVKDKALYKEIISYSGWNLFGSAANVIKGQGLNVLLNMFFSPAVSAARGIANQINSAVTQFFSNFYTAVRPQITKYYAQGDLNSMFHLVFQSSRLSYYLILIIALPILIETPTIINLWLGQTPEYTVIFTRLIVLITAVDAIANPLMTTAHATGKIALYQSVVGSTIVLNIPISYLFLKNGGSPVIVFIVSLIISVSCIFLRLWIVKRLVKFPVVQFCKRVLMVIVRVSFFAALIPVTINCLVQNLYLSLFLVVLFSFFCTALAVYLTGIEKEERIALSKLLHSKTMRLLNHFKTFSIK